MRRHSRAKPIQNTRRTDIGFQASPVPATAERTIERETCVTPFTCAVRSATLEGPVDDDTCANACSHQHNNDMAEAAPRPTPQFCLGSPFHPILTGNAQRNLLPLVATRWDALPADPTS